MRRGIPSCDPGDPQRSRARRPFAGRQETPPRRRPSRRTCRRTIVRPNPTSSSPSYANALNVLRVEGRSNVVRIPRTPPTAAKRSATLTQETSASSVSIRISSVQRYGRSAAGRERERSDRCGRPPATRCWTAHVKAAHQSVPWSRRWGAVGSRTVGVARSIVPRSSISILRKSGLALHFDASIATSRPVARPSVLQSTHPFRETAAHRSYCASVPPYGKPSITCIGCYPGRIVGRPRQDGRRGEYHTLPIRRNPRDRENGASFVRPTTLRSAAWFERKRGPGSRGDAG
jgi:hypothetical protein